VSVSTSSDAERALWALRQYDTTALATVSEAGPHVAGVFFAPELTETGLQLVIATIVGSRKQREMMVDPRVAFMCSPGNPSRWVQGTGRAQVITDPAQKQPLAERLIAHASGARPFIERLSTHPAIITVETLKVVEEVGRPPLLLHFDAA
jgi:pyridoxine/pyridoxamine 5'-phosphate oxidase